jgi:hypothetical protein
MLAAILLVFAATSQATAPTTAIAVTLLPVPQPNDVRLAMIDHWVKISSTGYTFNDYAIRNLVCVAAPLPTDYQQAKANMPTIMTDMALSQAKCSYEYATMPMRKKKARSGPIWRAPAPHSEKQIRRIPQDRWMKEERVLIRFNRKACLMMSRTPQPGECDDYWAISL